MLKSAFFKTKGMQRDLSASAFNPEYAYENKNIRIMSTDENTLLSIINEKGNKFANISFRGTPIGQASIDDELIIFTAGDTETVENVDISGGVEPFIDEVYFEFIDDIDSNIEDRIYKLWFNDTVLTCTEIYKGQLNFNYEHPIETISFYENQEIKKIYWTDGLNQPRVINIAATPEMIVKWNDTSFDFIEKLKLQETVTINRNIVANGTFAPGVIQYAFTYFNKYGQESNIFYVSPLYYISYNNRGASPEDKIGNSFSITIDNIDGKFDYVRIYSIHRTSIDAIPTVKKVVDLALLAVNELFYERIEVSHDIGRRTILLEKNSTRYFPLSALDLGSVGDDAWKSILFPDGSYIPINSTTGNGRLTIQSNNDGYVIAASTADAEFKYCSLTNSVSYTDNGVSGDIIDPTELLYVGGEKTIFGTMAQKDNTLFLGDIKIERRVLSSNIRNYFKGNPNIEFTADKIIAPPNPKGYYPYNNQLKMNSYEFKTFKYLEVYRLGVQFQHYTGKWSEPVWINDVRNTVHINTTFYSSDDIVLPIAQFTLSDFSIVRELISNGYIRIRPVVVYPSLSDREAICQGILCPTVYNVEDRFNNSPFVQSSWFARPNAPFDCSSNSWAPLDGSSTDTESIYSTGGIMSNDIHRMYSGYIEAINKGAWAEFRHNKPIPGNNKRNAEIQCISNPGPPYVEYPHSPNIAADPNYINNWVHAHAECYYVDQSILTLHSPDIEFDNNVRSIDTSGLKLRIVGVVPLTSFASDIDIQTSTPVNNFENSSDHPIGFYKEHFGAKNEFTSSGTSHFGWKELISGPFWLDEVTDSKLSNSDQIPTAFVVYPWHRNGSLNNTKFATDGYKSAMLDKKKISNMRFSYKTQYMDLNNIWNAYISGDSTKTGISGVSVFDSGETTLTRLPAPENSILPDINYYGNVDKIVTVPATEDNPKGEYPIMVSGAVPYSHHRIFIEPYRQLSVESSDQNTSIDAVRIRYKSTPHAVLALNYSSSGNQRILPTISDTQGVLNPVETIPSYSNPFWDTTIGTRQVMQEVIDPHISGDTASIGGIQYGWLWLGELYNDNVQNRFGGQTEEAFENNQWLPCGDPVSLLDINYNQYDPISITWTEGDTYYQRYDCLKTYPFTLEEQNAVTEIVSFLCETRVNLDGRYDRNRGQTSNLAITPENFNKMNDVYSQQNNFFNYRSLNHDKLNLDNFHNSITWTKTKTAGELIDTWTNITLASTLDLDGDKGDVRAIRRLNNNLIAFQDRGISQILYNENMQISSTEGVPIEIANSGKVNGKRYLSDKIGCTNKWSICETPNGIYFIDDITKGIFLFNDKLNNLSDKLGFHSWMNTKSSGINIWNPVDFDGFVTYYDKINGDVFFISKNECLAFSEPLAQFTSFYSYEHTPYFANLEDRGIAINTSNEDIIYKAWLHNEGDYNMYFGKYQPFYTTIIANSDMPLDKIFNNLEFRSDSWDKNDNLLNTTFDTLTVWNEYQHGVSTLNNILGRPSGLKRKFRIWRANIPRTNANGRDRMRNPWLYIKLSMEGENINKTILHDITVHYFE